MPYKFDLRQKSPKRRFLLIIGFTTFIACIILGLMIMFYEPVVVRLDLSQTQRLLFGGAILFYGLLRFFRLFKVEPEDEE